MQRQKSLTIDKRCVNTSHIYVVLAYLADPGILWTAYTKKFFVLVKIWAADLDTAITRSKNNHVRLKNGYFSRANSQGYIFLILQHFATKLCNFTHFKMLFPATAMVSFFLSRSKFRL
jgi:hypothetical protein